MEIEDHTETLKENIQHHAIHHQDSSANVMKYALTSAMYAILAAMASMFAGYYANEAMILQIKSSDSWSYYQAKSIKMNLLQSKIDIYAALNKKPTETELTKLSTYKNELLTINEKSQEMQKESAVYLERHVSFSRVVTLLQIAVAMTAFAIFVKRELFWHASLLFSFCGIIIALYSFFK